MYTRSTELYHYGVKGMKWGVRKKPIKEWKERRAVTNKHNSDIKTRYKNAKQKVEKGKISKDSREYKDALNARRQNLAGRFGAFALGFGKSDQGRYYQHRENGKTQFEAAIRTIGRKTLRDAAVYSSVRLGLEYMRRKDGLFSSIYAESVIGDLRRGR